MPQDIIPIGIIPIRRALLSVSDKTGIVDFARTLIARGVEIISTGGSANTLRAAGLNVTEVSELTGFPEILDGRVKTLAPQIHGGILARRDLPEHCEQMSAHRIAPIDLVAINLYPFERTVASGAPFNECIENIDIGGPALIRAAAKNHAFVTVLTAPEDYGVVLLDIETHGGTTPQTRKTLAASAYALTSAYDSAIASWFAEQDGQAYPKIFTIAGKLKQPLRYGENPHQSAAFYTSGRRFGIATAEQAQGKELSYNNINDADAAFECVAEFEEPAVVIVKHANPCGVATGENTATAWDLALACDPESAFGGVVALNRILDAPTAEKISQIFSEVIIAPGATEQARTLLAKKRNLRLLLTGGVPDPSERGVVFKSTAGGFLVQSRDDAPAGASDIKVVTKRAPSPSELADLLFAFRVCKHVKSNAIVYARAGATIGIGAGQMSRVTSARIAAWKAEAAGLKTSGCVVASDAFFPFADGLQAAIAAGGRAVIQPGGSIRDAEVIAAADEAGIAMVFTGIRHFRH